MAAAAAAAVAVAVSVTTAGARLPLIPQTRRKGGGGKAAVEVANASSWNPFGETFGSTTNPFLCTVPPVEACGGGGGDSGDVAAPSDDASLAARVCGIDVDEGLSNLNPIHGLADAPDLSLADACEAAKCHVGLKDWDSAIAIYAASKKAKKLAKAGELDPLSKEEAMALHIYTQESKFYKVCNTALRAQDRAKILPFFPYLKLVLRGLRKLPALDTTVYRGVKLDLSSTYPELEEFIWWGFTSTTSTIKVMESRPERLGVTVDVVNDLGLNQRPRQLTFLSPPHTVNTLNSALSPCVTVSQVSQWFLLIIINTKNL